HDLDNNVFYKHLQEHHGEEMARWCEPNWVICVPQQSAIENIPLTLPIIEAHALKQYSSTGQYVSALCGEGLIYEITGEEPRVIISNEEEGTEVVVSKATVLNEYLITVKDKVIHILLLDRLLSTTQDQDTEVSTQLLSTTITSFAQAEVFLRKFRCHQPLLQEIDKKVLEASKHIHPGNDVDQMQNVLQDVLIHCWETLLKKHSPTLQMNTSFQDVLFRALDYYVLGRLHEVLWWLVCERCQVVDQLVKTRLSHLRHANLSALQLGVPPNYYTPLPAAVVELASLPSVESAVGRLQCVNSTIDLIQ
ncbi:hypothetical protein OTU49_008825, partial [Cherax quadricarinatus]